MVIWARKGYRIVMGLIFPTVYYFTPERFDRTAGFLHFSPIVVSIISLFLILIIVLEVERHRHPGLWPYITQKTYGKIFKKEPGRILGTTSFLAASLLSILFFEKGVAIAVLLFSVFGDAASAIVGLKYGKTKLFGEKSLEGSLAFFIICFFVGLFLIGSRRLFPVFGGPTKLFLILVGSIAASVIELLPISLDDNLTIPLFSGAVMEVVKRVA